MATLVIRNVPDDLYAKLKHVAAGHHRSMTQEAIVVLKTALNAEPPASKPDWEQIRQWLQDEVWSRPVVDARSADDILDYDDHGLPR